jgi:signal peptidase I
MIYVVAMVVIAAAGWTVWLRRRYVYATVTSESMMPTLKIGDRVLVRRTTAERVRVGDVVVITRPAGAGPGWVVKRVVALPGDPVPRDGFPALQGFGPGVVPPGRLVVLGDLGLRSQDSKQLGYFNTADLLGIVPRRLVGTRSPVSEEARTP